MRTRFVVAWLAALAAPGALAIACGGEEKPTCDRAARHAVDLMIQETSGDAREAYRSKRDAIEKDAREQCVAAHLSDKELACSLAAKSVREIETCRLVGGTGGPTCEQAVPHAIKLMIQTPKGTNDGRSALDEGEAAILEEAVATCNAMKLTADDLQCVLKATVNDEMARCRLFTETEDLPFPPTPPGPPTCHDTARRYIYVMNERMGEQKPPVLMRAMVRGKMRGEADRIEEDCKRESWSLEKRGCIMRARDMGKVLECQIGHD